MRMLISNRHQTALGSVQTLASCHLLRQSTGKYMLTNLPRDLGEGLNAALSIVPLGSQCWDIIPSQGRHNVHHGLSLVGVRRNHPRKEVIPGVVTQLWGCGCIADLRYLQNKREVISTHAVSCTMIDYHKRLNGPSWNKNPDVSLKAKYGFRTTNFISPQSTVHRLPFLLEHRRINIAKQFSFASSSFVSKAKGKHFMLFVAFFLFCTWLFWCGNERKMKPWYKHALEKVTSEIFFDFNSEKVCGNWMGEFLLLIFFLFCLCFWHLIPPKF